MMRVLLPALLMVSVSGCMKRAPTTYELSRRAGQPYPPAEPDFVDPKGKKKKGATFDAPVWANSNLAPSQHMPARSAPQIARVYMHDHQLPNKDGTNTAWLQGTWIFMEVRPAQWLPEVDPGAASLVVPQEER